MQSEEEFKKFYSIELSTPALRKEGEPVKLCAKFEKARALLEYRNRKMTCVGWLYLVFLYDGQTGQSIKGRMDLEVFSDPEPYPESYPQHASIYTEQGRQLPRVNILYIRNDSEGDYRHLGSALHEAALRWSFMIGYEGRLTLTAVRETHYFHYLHGFRQPDPEYYFQLASLVHDSYGKRITQGQGDGLLYLPKHCLLENLKKFQMNDVASDRPTEDEAALKRIQFGERVMAGVLKPDCGFEALILLTRPYGKHEDQKKGTMSLEEELLASLRKPESLSCDATKKLLNLGRKLIVNELPADSAEKQQRIRKLLVGTALLAMMCQDLKYGAQELYGNENLYPENDFEKALDPFNTLEAAILAHGETTVTVEQLSRFFPTLEEFPELVQLLQSNPGPTLK